MFINRKWFQSTAALEITLTLIEDFGGVIFRPHLLHAAVCVEWSILDGLVHFVDCIISASEFLRSNHHSFRLDWFSLRHLPFLSIGPCRLRHNDLDFRQVEFWTVTGDLRGREERFPFLDQKDKRFSIVRQRLIDLYLWQLLLDFLEDLVEVWGIYFLLIESFWLLHNEVYLMVSFPEMWACAVVKDLFGGFYGVESEIYLHCNSKEC